MQGTDRPAVPGQRGRSADGRTAGELADVLRVSGTRERNAQARGRGADVLGARSGGPAEHLAGVPLPADPVGRVSRRPDACRSRAQGRYVVPARAVERLLDVAAEDGGCVESAEFTAQWRRSTAGGERNGLRRRADLLRGSGCGHLCEGAGGGWCGGVHVDRAGVVHRDAVRTGDPRGSGDVRRRSGWGVIVADRRAVGWCRMSAAKDGLDWRSRAACVDTEPELFFPVAESGPVLAAQVGPGEGGVRGLFGTAGVPGVRPDSAR